jgi:hypothetical protein
LWVLRTKEGAIELVFSNVRPDHPDWPGRVKGWPEPSLEYRRERWELYRYSAQSDVKLYHSLLSKLQSNPQQRLREVWERNQKSRNVDMSAFTGPEDPAFAAYLKKDYLEGLKSSELKLEQVMKAKP